MTHPYQDELDRATRNHEIWKIGFESGHRKLQADLVARHGAAYVDKLKKEALKNEKH